jgi:hypothetical protein
MLYSSRGDYIMDTCPYCKEKIKEDAKNCPHCGKDIFENRPLIEKIFIIGLGVFIMIAIILVLGS